MTVKEIAKVIEKNAPKDIALSFDNVGLLIGDYNAEISGVVIAVDLTRDVIEKALKIGANLIITHHPIIFNGFKQLIKGNYEQEIVMLAVRGSLNVYACHTNADNADKGLNYVLADRLGGKNIVPLGDDGGVIADIDTDIDNFLERVSDEIKGIIKVNMPFSNDIKRFAMITGSGGKDGTLVSKLNELDVDCYLTAEVSHNVRLAFIDSGIGLIEFGHYESERIFIDIMSDWLNKSGLNIVKVFNDAFSN